MALLGIFQKWIQSLIFTVVEVVNSLSLKVTSSFQKSLHLENSYLWLVTSLGRSNVYSLPKVLCQILTWETASGQEDKQDSFLHFHDEQCDSSPRVPSVKSFLATQQVPSYRWSGAMAPLWEPQAPLWSHLQMACLHKILRAKSAGHRRPRRLPWAHILFLTGYGLLRLFNIVLFDCSIIIQFQRSTFLLFN